MKIPRLREARLRRALSQHALAQRAGVSRQTVVSAEAGGDLSVATVARLTTALELARPITERLPELAEVAS